MGSRVPQVEPAIVAAACKGDTAAQGRLYEICAPMVYTLARRMLASPALAEDVLQDTFVEVLRKLHTWRGEAGVGFWVRRIAVNKCLMYLRSSWHSRRVDAEAVEALYPPAQTPRADHQIALERALAELPAVSRAVVWLHDAEGYTHKEIGALMGRTTSFSKSQLARAHKRLRTSIDGAQADGEGRPRIQDDPVPRAADGPGVRAHKCLRTSIEGAQADGGAADDGAADGGGRPCTPVLKTC